MRFLCLCHVITPALAPILEHIASLPANQLLIAQAHQKKDIDIPGARLVKLKRPQIKKAPRSLTDCWQIATQIGKCAMQSLETIAQSGFSPDVILLATFSGASLCLGDIFPEGFQVAYLETLAAENETVMRYRRQMREIQIMESDLVYDLSGAQQAQPGVRRGPLCVNSSFFRPLGSSGADQADKFAGIVFGFVGLSDIETGRWLETMQNFSRIRAEKIYAIMPNMAGAKKAESLGVPDLSCGCNLSNAGGARLFGQAKLLVWPSGVIAPELLQAMSCGVAIVSRGVEGLLKPGINCFPMPENNLPDALRKLAREHELLERMGLAARKTVLDHFTREKIIPPHIAEIMAAMPEDKRDGQLL